MQEQVFLATGRLLEQRHVRLVHVGYRPFSSLTPGAFSERILHLGTGQQPPAPMRSGLLITAEVTTNHLGDVERAKTMMRMAKAQGANLVKFQMRDVESFYRAEVLDGPYPSPFGQTFREYRLGLELDDDEFREIDAYARLAEQHPHIIPGYSSHDEGWFGSALAVACGARMVEKHVKLGSNEWLHFDSVALDLEGGDFGDFVAALRKAEVAAGQPDKRVTPSEHHKY